MLLTSLNPLAINRGDDVPDAVRIGETTLSRSDILGAATSVAERVSRAERVAVLATPSATTILAVVGCLIAGVVVIERVFTLPGVGQMLVKDIQGRDLEKVQGTLLILATIVLVVGFLVDVLQRVIDPRLREHRR